MGVKKTRDKNYLAYKALGSQEFTARAFSSAKTIFLLYDGQIINKQTLPCKIALDLSVSFDLASKGGDLTSDSTPLLAGYVCISSWLSEPS